MPEWRAAAGRDIGELRVLVTNDDGIHAPGLALLEEIARSLAREVWVVAPESEQSAMSHALTMRRPLTERELALRRFAVDGTPTDCALVAVRSIMRDAPPDLVLSGINHGFNLGEDIHYSGTVAAAMEATLLGVRAIALSQGRMPDDRMDWEVARAFAPEVVARLAALDWPPGVLMNVNFPACPPDEVAGIRPSRQGRRDQGVTVHDVQDPRGRPYVWIGQFQSDTPRDPDTDLHAIVEKAIPVTPLNLDLTDRETLDGLKDGFG